MQVCQLVFLSDGSVFVSSLPVKMERLVAVHIIKIQVYTDFALKLADRSMTTSHPMCLGLVSLTLPHKTLIHARNKRPQRHTIIPTIRSSQQGMNMEFGRLRIVQKHP